MLRGRDTQLPAGTWLTSTRYRPCQGKLRVRSETVLLHECQNRNENNKISITRIKQRLMLVVFSPISTSSATHFNRQFGEHVVCVSFLENP